MHTKFIQMQTSSVLREHLSTIDEGFATFDNYFDELEKLPATLERNVKMMLACKFLNHVYSAFILAESGLIVDAILCERNAIETIAFHWLVCLDPNAAVEYEQGNIPRPVEVRRRLENLGADVTHIRNLYTSGSETSHVGRKSERFHSQWESPSKGILLIGGALALEDQAKMFDFLPVLLLLFCEPLGASK